ncbi:ADP-ribosylation factor-binding protein GGA1 isoform X1 [Strongylocentrotus purpuratus]|uniref:ADP-ribosylation factor-binding protein GGA1 n=1 Tax=Strongylocentrotus purpuratus TaxID=7668 RepID=A0A7M7NQ13_STRPU|nr:ADP-ribosylation factor-binding protein GGA1 isoform X1 [Strongylocentrotus purpuratus]
MAEGDDWETLETLLNKATNPSNRDDDWEYIMNFCDRVNSELEGALLSCRLLGHKIQSPQEREALQALTVIEACVKNCGELFHRELGKFRFLNEMIKLISPKYLGNKTTEKVKKKTIELMYSWQKGLPHEGKIVEAYDMLKKQGLVKEDPTYLDEDLFPSVPPPKAKMAEFEDEEKSKLLARLLKSKHPEDLQAANRLIKNMVKEDEKRLEKVSRRTNELESCNNNVKLLNEMLTHYREGYTSPEERELMKELYLTCERMRPSLFRLASDADEKDDCIADILETNDAVVKVMEVYKEKFGIEDLSTSSSGAEGGGAASNLLDSSKLIDFAGSSPVKQQGAASAPPDPSQQDAEQDSTQLLASELSSLGLSSEQPANKVVQPTSASDLDKLLGPGPVAPSVPSTTQAFPAFNTKQAQQMPARMPMYPTPQQQQLMMQQQQMAQIRASSMGMMGMQPGYPMMQQMPQQQQVAMGSNQVTPVFPTQPKAAGSISQTPASTSSSSSSNNPAISSNAFADLESLGRGLIKPKTKEETPAVADDQLLFLDGSPQIKAPTKNPEVLPITPTITPQAQASVPAATPTPQPTTQPTTQTVLSLADVFVPLESVQPGSTPPVTAYEKNNVKTIFHFAKDSPRPDVLVVVVSTMSTNTSPIKNLTFLAAVPKTMRVKLQPPSATDLPAYNPILPPSAITQVMLLANPNKEKIRLRFKMQYTLNDLPFTELGEVDKMPSH